LLASDADQYIVLEDDVIVDWKALVQLYEHNFSSDGHDYIRLFYKRPTKFLTIREKYISRNTSLISLLGRAYGTQGYIVTREGAKRLLPACLEVRRPIDDQMDRFWEHGVPNLSIFPFPILEEAVTSSIGIDRFEKPKTHRSLAQRILVRKDKFFRSLFLARVRLGLEPKHRPARPR
jgi:glycosyl transferase, family 25